MNANTIRPIRKILVANRGEIALRVMKTAREMGIKTVAVYSDADRYALFARYADEAIHIGPAPSSESYLIGEKIIEAALSVQADAIHPGYGFLSENAGFADAVRQANIAFIGPQAQAIQTMGSKLAAKETVKPFGVPLVPGTDHPILDVQQAEVVAEKIGFPLLIKASAGGGGKGMRVVEKMSDLPNAFERAVSEAVNSFADGSVFIERFVTSPRHIEIQILADAHGNCVHLFERECSIQRRHQKVIEEAPSAVLTPALRDEMGLCAIQVAKSCKYEGAGTVEFLLDDQHRFYFLEMNTRLQVEHPVTECITNVDLVREQIRIAEGHVLPFKQADLEIRGHAIEVRVYAEDASAGFLPTTGTLRRYSLPSGPGIRVDNGVEEGQEIPIYYDPMLSKLVVYGNNREAAIERTLMAIDEYEITGVSTTLDFGRFAIDHDAFRSGNFDTHFVNEHFNSEALERASSLDDKALAELVVGMMSKAQSVPDSASSANEAKSVSNWKNRKHQS
jgi:acetyl-CoA carboxylase biotin carboxylase subunit